MFSTVKAKAAATMTNAIRIIAVSSPVSPLLSLKTFFSRDGIPNLASPEMGLILHRYKLYAYLDIILLSSKYCKKFINVLHESLLVSSYGRAKTIRNWCF